MKKPSLQKIENFYLQRGYSEETLRKALEKDKEYQKALRKRKQELSKQATTPLEKREYVLSMNADFEILKKCKQLQKCKLSNPNKQLIRLTKSQRGHE